MSNLIKVYDPIKGWVKPSERTTVYRSREVERIDRPLRDGDIVECQVCKTGNLIIKGTSCGLCANLRRKGIAA